MSEYGYSSNCSTLSASKFRLSNNANGTLGNGQYFLDDPIQAIEQIRVLVYVHTHTYINTHPRTDSSPSLLSFKATLNVTFQVHTAGS